MSKVAALTPVASKMLLRLLEVGGENESQDELMEAAGIGSRSQFFKAKAQLKELSLLDDEGNVNFVVASSVPQRGIVLFAKRGEPAPPIDMDMDPEPILLGDTWLAKAMQADLLPSDGDTRQKNSNFQVRRRAQIAILQAVFKEYFAYNLTPDKAKELLHLTGDFAEDVLEACDKTKASPKKIEFPFGYVKSILGREQQTVKQVDLDRPGPDGDGDHSFYLAKPSDRTAKVTAKLQALGLLEDDDDDY